MQIKNVMFCALILVARPCTPSFSAMPQGETSRSQHTWQFVSKTSGGDMRQSALDPHGFDSGLWRAEYLTQPADDDDAQDNPSVAVPRDNGNTVGSFIYSDNLATMPIEIPVVIEKSQFQAVGESDAVNSAPTMSDWEYAAVTATNSTTIGFTASGPSATSAIVGFVGIIIVIGAYASSGERKR